MSNFSAVMKKEVNELLLRRGVPSEHAVAGRTWAADNRGRAGLDILQDSPAGLSLL